MKSVSHDALVVLDPRARILCAAGCCMATALATQPVAVIPALCFPLIVGVIFRFPFRRLSWMAVRLNGIFILMALTTLPFVDGPAWRSVGPLTITSPGAHLMGVMILKGNALVLSCAVFLSTMESASLGHALSRLRVPTAFVQLLMSVIRYIDVLLEEHARIRLAMRARGFCPQFNVLTLRTHAVAVGALFLRSLDRAEQVADAMKCRGHHGTYAATRTLHWRTADSVWIGTALSVIMVMFWLGWSV